MQSNKKDKRKTGIVTRLRSYNPKPMNRMHASDMKLWTSSEASCLTFRKTRSRVAGFHFHSDTPNDDMQLLGLNPPLNSSKHSEVDVLKIVSTSASEDELGVAHVNAKKCACGRRTLENGTFEGSNKGNTDRNGELDSARHDT